MGIGKISGSTETKVLVSNLCTFLDAVGLLAVVASSLCLCNQHCDCDGQ